MTEISPSLPSADANLPVYTVGELSLRLKREIEDRFGLIRVRGEISGLKRHASGHVYLRLKDADAVLEGVVWRGGVARLGLKPEDGMEVICTGRLSTYAPRSQYQIVIERMELAGVGALMALLEARKKKLEQEGLFARPKPAPPYLPEVIGLVTSPTGAVIRDILHRLAERFPRRVLLWPVLVQGEGAAEQIARAILGFNRLSPSGPIPRPDLLIVARGGGSIEDLWPFNEEIVVRAAAASEIPLISAVGHETDVTLIDFAAAKRAPTPTAAAEMAVPVRRELLADIAGFAARLIGSIERLLTERAKRIEALARGLRGPRELWQLASQSFDDLAERLERGVRQLGRERKFKLAKIAAGLRPRALRRELAELKRRWREAALGVRREWTRYLELHRQRLLAEGKVLQSLSYHAVLGRGFAIVRSGTGQAIVRAAMTFPGQAIDIEFRDDHRGATIAGEAKPAKALQKALPGKSSAKSGQGDLF
jgi:exodeoxyribonuclease VII large subunit